MAIQYFDSNICVGKRGLKHRREIWRSEDILASMDRAGIGAALVYAGWARDYAPRYGNERLLEELAKSSRFYGCYTIMPGCAGDFYDPETMVSDLRAKGMVAAKMFPGSHHYAPDEITMGPSYSALEKAGIPLLADFGEIGWRELREILEAHPQLKLLLQGASWTEEHGVFAYLQAFPNLYVELSNLQANRVIESLVERVGAERVVFGSGLPKMSAGAARALIDYAEISEEQKQLIAGGNLARLCGIPVPPAAPVTGDEIAREAARGEPLGVYVFDSHTHFLEDGGCCGGGYAMVDGDLAHMAALNDRIGVNDYCVAPWLGIWTDSEAGNRIALNMAARDPRVHPYVLIDPNYVEDVEGEAYRYHIEHRMPGMKMFYARTRVRYNDPVFDPWWKIADENGLFGLMDSGDYPLYLKDMEDLAQRYPHVSLFLDHAGRNFATAEEYAQLAKQYENVYLQLTYTSVPEGVIEYLYQEGLAHKTLYGTDAPMRDPRPQLGWVAFADIPMAEKRLILGGNMQRILKRCFAQVKERVRLHA